MSSPNDISRAIQVLMDASPEFRAALEKAAQKLAEAMEALDTPEMRKALENAGAKVAEFEQATRRVNTVTRPLGSQWRDRNGEVWTMQPNGCLRLDANRPYWNADYIEREYGPLTRIANGDDEPPALEAS